MTLDLASQAARNHIYVQYSVFWLFIVEATGSDIFKRFCLLLQWDIDSVCFVETIVQTQPLTMYLLTQLCSFLHLHKSSLVHVQSWSVAVHSCDTMSRCVWSYLSGRICVSLHKATWLCCHGICTVLSVHIQYAQVSWYPRMFPQSVYYYFCFACIAYKLYF